MIREGSANRNCGPMLRMMWSRYVIASSRVTSLASPHRQSRQTQVVTKMLRTIASQKFCARSSGFTVRLALTPSLTRYISNHNVPKVIPQWCGPLIVQLDESALFRQQAYVNGQWIDAKDGKTFDIIGIPHNSASLSHRPCQRQEDRNTSRIHSR